MRVLVTGATGFVGRRLCENLVQRGYSVRAALRNDRAIPTGIQEKAVVGDIAATTEWATALNGVDAVLHLAARAHVLNDAPANSQLYDEVNVRGTKNLAEAAARSGVRRFVFLSSAKVNGEDSLQGAFTAADPPRPEDAYGKSKWLAEQALAQIAGTSAMQVAIVRSPLVYGPGVRANFLRLMSWVDRGIPLPLGAIRNRRSLVSIWTLSDLLSHLLEHPAMAGTWMVSDGEDFSTPELIRRIGDAMSRRVRLIPAPAGLLRFCGSLLGKKAEIARLCGSLAVDMTRTRECLEWSPPLCAEEALSRTASWYLSEGRPRET